MTNTKESEKEMSECTDYIEQIVILTDFIDNNHCTYPDDRPSQIHQQISQRYPDWSQETKEQIANEVQKRLKERKQIRDCVSLESGVKSLEI